MAWLPAASRIWSSPRARVDELLAKLAMLTGAEVLAPRSMESPVLPSMEVLEPLEMQPVRWQSKRSPPEGSSEALLSAGVLVPPPLGWTFLDSLRGLWTRPVSRDSFPGSRDSPAA